MKTWKWLPVVSAALLAGAVFAQSGVAGAIGCSVPKTFDGSLQVASCVDGSAVGGAKFLSLDTVSGVKTYRLTANIRANSAPSPNVAKTQLFNDKGKLILEVPDTNTGASAQTRDLGVQVGTNLTAFKFISGDNSGA